MEKFFQENEHLIFHTPAYRKFIEEAFDCDYEILTFKKNGLVKIVLPVVKIKSWLFGNKLISSPYLEYGGFAGDIQYANKIVEFLNEKYGRKYGYLEIRGEGTSGMIRKNLYKRFVLELQSEGLVWGGIQKSKRKAIKKALKNLEIKEISFSDFNLFYDLYCWNMREFGSPPYGRDYFISFYRNIIERKLGKVFGAYCEDKLAAALVGFCYQDRVHIIIAISDPAFSKYRPNDAVHWEFIKWAIDHGYKYFDFGKVREDSGQFEYKRKWGAELFELPSYFLLWKKKEVPWVDPGGYVSLVKLWRKMPLWFTKLIGPWLRKGLGI